MIHEIVNNWTYIATYLALGWVVGVMLFYFAFMEHDVSMGGNGTPLPYHIVHMPSTAQALLYIVAMMLWPLTLVAVAILVVVRLVMCIAESKNIVLPCIVKWLFGWPIFIVMAICDQCVEHVKEEE